jgi:hypothetical protein
MLGLDASAAAAYASLAAYKTELEPAVAAVVANNTVRRNLCPCATRGESAMSITLLTSRPPLFPLLYIGCAAWRERRV